MARPLVSAHIPDSVSQKACVYMYLEAGEGGTELTQRCLCCVVTTPDSTAETLRKQKRCSGLADLAGSLRMWAMTLHKLDDSYLSDFLTQRREK